MKLQTKIVLILLPVIILPLFFLGWITFNQFKQLAETRAVAEAKAIFRHLNDITSWELKTAKANIELFSQSGILEKYLLTTDEDKRYTLFQPPLLRLFNSYQKVFPIYYEIRILLPDGFEDTRVTLDENLNKTEKEGDSEYFKELQKSKEDLFTSFIINPDNQKFSYLVSKRIKLIDPATDTINTPETLRGYLVLTINPKEVVELIKSTAVGKEGIFFLTDEKGNIVASPDRSDFKESRLPEKLFKELLEKSIGEDLYETVSLGKKNLFMGKRLENNLILFMMLPEKEIIDAGRRVGVYFLLITLLAIIFMIFIIFICLKHLLLRPIVKLEKATEELGKGNLGIDIDINSSDEVGKLAISFSNMAKSLRESQDKIQKLAYHDPLTGLPNRRMFIDYLEQGISRAARTGEKMAILLIDIDNFKRVNDSLGHYLGNILLQQIAIRLTQGLRRSDIISRKMDKKGHTVIARPGGDEFTVIVSGIKDLNNASLIARRELELLSKPFKLEGHEVFVSGSIGITIFPDDGKSSDELIKNADIAMYYAKDRGKNNFQYFSEQMNSLSVERLKLESDLRKALERDEFLLYYQPQVDTRTGEIKGLEALIRWQHPERGFMPPISFIPAAEESGIIVPIGEWVIRTACRQMKSWIDNGIEGISVSVNLSSLQFRYQQVDKLLKKILEETNLPASYLEVELTESSIMQAEETAAKVLQSIKNIGVKIALDDFGTGYSSLSYLKQFPIDTLKIDRSFVIDMLKDRKGGEIVTAIIQLAKCLELSVVAEGVETEKEYEYLLDKECKQIQGYYFSKPLPAAEVEKLLEKRFIKPVEVKPA